MTNKNQYGFTLYELMITLVVVGVVLTVGLPNLSEFTQSSRMSATANDLHSSFQLARSEAARAKTPITICASADSTTVGKFSELDELTILLSPGHTLLNKKTRLNLAISTAEGDDDTVVLERRPNPYDQVALAYGDGA